MKRLFAALAAVLLTCAPSAAQNVATLPIGQPLAGSERMPGQQGAGCPTKAQPCATVAITPALLGTYLTGTFQAKDGDLDAIAALATQPFGRGLLTLADASAARTNLGLATIAATGAGGDLTTTAVAYTPTVTASSGSFTTITRGACSYIRIGKLVVFTIDVTLTSVGTASGSLQVTLPSTSGYPAITLVSEYRAVGRVDQGNMSAGSNILTISKLDNSSSIAAGAGFRFSGYYLES